MRCLRSTGSRLLQEEFATPLRAMYCTHLLIRGMCSESSCPRRFGHSQRPSDAAGRENDQYHSMTVNLEHIILSFLPPLHRLNTEHGMSKTSLQLGPRSRAWHQLLPSSLSHFASFVWSEEYATEGTKWNCAGLRCTRQLHASLRLKSLLPRYFVP